MKDARVSLAQESSADEEVMAIFLAGVVLGFGLGGSPEMAQPVTAVILLIIVRTIVILSLLGVKMESYQYAYQHDLHADTVPGATSLKG